MAGEDIYGEDVELPEDDGVEEAEAEQEPAPEPEAEKQEVEPDDKDEDELPEAAEKAEESEGEQKPGKPPKGFVPHQALHEERENRKQLQRQLQETQQRVEQLAKLEEEFRAARNQKTEQEKQEEDIRAYEDDPIGYLRQKNERLEQQLNQFQGHLTESQKASQEMAQQQEQIGQLVNHIRGQEDEYRQTAPDYDDAFNYLQENMLNEMKAYGIADQQQLQGAFYQRMLEASVTALQNGKNAAETIYEAAKLRGYSGKQSQQQQSEAENKVNNVKRGQKASKTLSGGGTGSDGHESQISLTDMEKWSDEEFDQFWEQMRKDANG